MWRDFGKREAWMWTAFACFLSFGLAAVLVQRLRQPGPLEIKDVPVAVTPPTKPQETPPPASSAVPQETAPVTTPTTSEEKTKKTSRKELPPQGSISLNQASVDDLQQLPGVGPTTAAAIIQYRNDHGLFQSIDDLRNVKGIGPKRLENIRPYVTL